LLSLRKKSARTVSAKVKSAAAKTWSIATATTAKLKAKKLKLSTEIRETLVGVSRSIQRKSRFSKRRGGFFIFL
jgi:hypothetical protein